MTWQKCCSWDWPLVQKLALPKKDMTLQTGLSHVESTARKELAVECQLTYQEVKILTCRQYPKITPRNKRSAWGKGQTWKNEYVNQGGPTKNTKNNHALLPAPLD